MYKNDKNKISQIFHIKSENIKIKTKLFVLFRDKFVIKKWAKCENNWKTKQQQNKSLTKNALNYKKCQVITNIQSVKTLIPEYLHWFRDACLFLLSNECQIMSQHSSCRLLIHTVSWKRRVCRLTLVPAFPQSLSARKRCSAGFWPSAAFSLSKWASRAPHALFFTQTGLWSTDEAHVLWVLQPLLMNTRITKPSLAIQHTHTHTLSWTKSAAPAYSHHSFRRVCNII